MPAQKTPHPFAPSTLPYVTLDHAIERIYALKVDTTTRDGDGTSHEKPHKPLLLHAALSSVGSIFSSFTSYLSL
jgi:hypothetical protein